MPLSRHKLLYKLPKLAVECSKADYRQSNKYAEGITIVYRPNCSDCKKILPKLYFIETWKNIGNHIPMRIYNANKLSHSDLEQLEISHTPSLIVNGKSHKAKTVEIGEKFWHSNTSSFNLK